MNVHDINKLIKHGVKLHLSILDIRPTGHRIKRTSGVLVVYY